MPTRPAVHMRGRRVWGSRFDTLNTSPVRTIPSSSPHSSVNSPETPNLTRSTRDWADDEVPATILMSGKNDGATPPVTTPKDSSRIDTPKMPHSASVFVGSLPPNLEEAELSRLLAQHLSQYAKIHNVKIIHDAKGGVCAFVQCETAGQAANIISQSQVNPKLFMGRQLRYESARAYRTLWISYRKPTQFVPCDDVDEGDAIINEFGVRGRLVEMDPPDAMRIWRPRDSRHPMVCYREEARNFDTSKLDLAQSGSNAPDALDGDGVLFADVPFDGNTIHKIAASFGPLESFKRYAGDQAQGGDNKDAKDHVQPLGHDGPRSVGMEDGVWEAKWEHRDDCVCALATLKRVPHLVVSKAIQPQQTPFQSAGKQPYVRSPYSPRFPTISIPHTPLLLDRNNDQRKFRETFDPFLSPSSTISPAQLLSPTVIKRNGPPGLTSKSGNQAWATVSLKKGFPVTGHAESPSSSFEQSSHPSGSNTWRASDFPPLRVQGGQGTHAGAQAAVSQPSASESDVSEINESSSVKTLTNTEADCDSGNDASNKTLDWESPQRPNLTHRRSMSNPVSSAISKDDSQSISSTGESTGESSSYVTPVTPTSALPPSFHCPNFTCAGHDKCFHKCSNDQFVGDNTYHREQDVDPKTVFVGGLDAFGPDAWGVDRLRAVFEKYGVVEDVKLICPSNKKTLFAFVTFSEESSSLRAIQGEHNRVYDGRVIRVQLRDRQPGRSVFKLRTRISSARMREFQEDARHEPWRYNRNGPLDSRNADGRKAMKELTVNTNAYIHTSELESPSGSRFVRSVREAPVTLTNQSESGSAVTAVHMTNDPHTASAHTDASSTTLSVTPPPPFTATPASPSSVNPGVVNYPTHGWQAYAGPVPYALPYNSYPGLMPVAYPMVSPTGANPGGSVSDMNAPMQWSTMYRAPMPYTSFSPYPYVPYVPPQTDAQRTVPRPSTPNKNVPQMNLAPGVPTPTDQPAPVYRPPETTDDYSSGPMGSTTTAPHVSPQSQQPVNVPTTGPPMNTAQFWPGYPPHTHYYPYPVAAGVPPVQQPMAHAMFSGQYPSSNNGSWFQAPMTSPAHMRTVQPIPVVNAATTDSRVASAYYPSAPVSNMNNNTPVQQQRPLHQEQHAVVTTVNTHNSVGRHHFRRDHYPFSAHHRGRGSGGAPSAYHPSGKLNASGENQHGQYQAHKDTLPIQIRRND